MQKKKEGISLIVLVITIIVMIILAATIIISLTNNGIISKASEAVDKTNEKQVEELASLAWANAYADNVGKSDEELLQALKTSVEKALSDNNLDKEDYGMEVTTTGVTIVKGWLQKSNRTVVKGSTTLNIGDYINYVSGVEGYTDTNGWQVLGAEDGELLILSAELVKDDYELASSDFTKSKDAYENGVTYLNSECTKYKNEAYGATNARSITLEDLNRILNFDKTTCGKGEIYEYGNIVTYSYNGTNKPAYSGSNGVTGTLSSAHSNGFHWYDENGNYHNVSASDLTNSENTGKIIGKVKITDYDADSMTELKNNAPNAYNMIILHDDGSWKDYWFATPICNYSCFGYYRTWMFNGDDAGPVLMDFVNTNGSSYNRVGVVAGTGAGVRAVVCLSKTVTGTVNIFV